MCQEITSADDEIGFERDKRLDVSNLFLARRREVQVREMQNANIFVACGQDRHLGLAEYIAHSHEKINPWDSKRHLRVI